MKLNDMLLTVNRRRALDNNHLLENRKRLPVLQPHPASKMIQALLVTICLVIFPYQGSSIILESGTVNDYEVVYPQKVLTLPKRGVQQNEQNAKYEDTMQYEFKMNGKPVVLHLEKNMGLFSKDYTETHYSHDGRQITTSPQVEDHCYYHGYIQSDTDSIATISACNGLKGNFKHQGEMYLIEPLELSDRGAHAVFKYESLEKGDKPPKICGVTSTSWESDEPLKKTSQMSVTPEEENEYMKAKKYIEFFVVVDNTVYRKYGGDHAKIKSRIFGVVNHLNWIYKVLDIHVALIGTEIWSDRDKIVVEELGDLTLDSFLEWRESDLLPRKRNDNAQLIMGIKMKNKVIGYSIYEGMCLSMRSGAIILDYFEEESSMASQMAHEMGHSLGMDDHDNTCTCQHGVCIMNATLGKPPGYEFSSCSLKQLDMYLRKNQPQCILNISLKKDIITPPVCGNELVEMGEECDCGSPEECKSEYCDAQECKLKPGAECDSEVCCEKGKFKGTEAECRAAKDDCDLPEFCTGQSAECPLDSFQKNGHPCQNNQGYCYNGKCPIMTNQCIALWGTGNKVSPDVCFNHNLGGNDYGYCRKENGINIPCKPKDVKCGTLYCTMDSAEDDYSCDWGNAEVDPGTKCGEGMVCSNRQCVDVETAYGSTNSFSQI